MNTNERDNKIVNIKHVKEHSFVEYKGKLNVGDVVFGKNSNQYKIYSIEFCIKENEYTGKIETSLRYLSHAINNVSLLDGSAYLVFTDRDINKSVFFTKKDLLLTLFSDCIEEVTELVVK